MTANAANPLVSVIIPVFNRGELLPRAIRSVLNQTYGNLELIIVDDGSHEDIKSIAGSFGDARIRYLRHDTNMGISAARNTGLKSANGEFIEFLDSDDEYLPEKTRKHLDTFTERETDIAYCGLWKDTDNQMRYYSKRFKKNEWFYLLQQIMMRKEVIGKNGFLDTSLVHMEDMDYVYRLSMTCDFAGTAEPLVICHENPKSHSRTRKFAPQYEEIFIRKHASTMSPGMRSRWLYTLGKNYLFCGKTVKAYKSFVGSFISYPLNEKALKKIVRLFPSLLFHIFKNTYNDKE